MLTLLRLVALIFGCALLVAPATVFLGFTYAVGEPPDDSFSFLFPELIGFGLLLGGGLVLVGIPKLVVGNVRPWSSQIAGLFLVFSALAITFGVGFSGEIPRVASPVALLIEFLAFYAFVFPARSFALVAEKHKP